MAKAGAAAPSGFAKHRLDSERRRAVPENPLYYVTAFASWRGEMSRARLFTRNGNGRRCVRLKRYLLQLALESVSAGTLLHVWRGARLLTCSRAMKRGGSRANIAKLPVLVRTAGLELSSTRCEGSRTTRKAVDCEKFT